MDKYREQSFLPQHMEIHWFSIINSSVLVLLLLVILVTIFTRVLKHDFAKFSKDEELGDEAEETGAHFPRLPHCLSAVAFVGDMAACVRPTPFQSIQ
jgi:hypothetical protein